MRALSVTALARLETIFVSTTATVQELPARLIMIVKVPLMTI